jgi:hypothetical protein
MLLRNSEQTKPPISWHFTKTPAPPSSQSQSHSGILRVWCPAAQETEPINYNPSRGGFMANLKGLASIVRELRTGRTNLVDRLRHVDAALSVLGKLSGGSSYTKRGHTVSASARKRMSLAQKARWAKAKGHAPKPKRTISAAGRKRIAAAQRARWAKLKAAKK